MKRLLAKSILLAGGMTVSSQLLALGLGEMNLDSALNQPLRADIALIDTAGLSIAEMKPKLASAEDFERAGVERYQFLTQMKFSVNGDRIVVTTRDPINEPFLNFLVELNWPSGRVLREYTVLLDPPVFEEGRVQPLIAVPAGAITSNTTVTSQPQVTTAPVKQKQTNQWSQPAAPGEYKVQPDDTLWQIALETRPNRSISPQQMMVALQDVNPDAFINGNINRLKTHTVLIVPDESIIETISGREAVVEVQRQNREIKASTAQIDATGRSNEVTGPRKTTGGGEVRLLSANTQGQSDQAGGSASGTAGNTASTEDELSIALENLDKSQRENKELVDRLNSLEQQLAQMERLIALQSDKMASMAAGVAENAQESNVAGAQTDDATATAPEVPAANTDATETTEEVAAAESSTATTETTSEVQQATADNTATESAQSQDGSAETDYNYSEEATSESTSEEAQPETEQITEEQRAEEAALLAMKERAAAEAKKAAEVEAKSPVDQIISTLINLPLNIIAIGLGGLLVLLSAILFMRKRKKDEDQAYNDVMADDSIMADLDNGSDDLNDFELPDDLDDKPAFGEAGRSGDSLEHFELHDDDLGEMPVSDDLDDLDLDEYDGEQGDQYETVGQTEDAISESDIYIAYGKFDQAVELLNGAIAAEPERVDLRLKHLEILASLDDNEAFAEAEGNLNALGDLDANAQAEEMRAQLSNPIEPTVSSDGLDGALSLDGEIPSFDEEAESEFDDGMDFGDALDFGDDLEPEDDGIGAALEKVPELELGEPSDFDATSEGVDMSLEDDAIKLDDNLLAFDLDDEEDDLDKADAIETDLADKLDIEETNKKEADEDDSDLEAFDFNVGATDATAATVTSLVNDDDDLTEETTDELEDLTFESPSVESAEEDGLDFEIEPSARENDELDDLLDTAELQTSEVEADELDNGSDDLEIDLSEIDLEDDTEIDLTELEDLAAEDDLEIDISEEAELQESKPVVESAEDDLDVPELGEIEDVEEVAKIEESTEEVELPLVANDDDNDDFADLESLMSSDADDLAENSDLIGGIDLDELAAADDEFDFLAGTDECATKLDLARAYVDMEDSDGARELLQEVIQEGTDEQKSEAKDMMDKLS